MAWTKIPIDFLDLSVKTCHILRKNGIETIEELYDAEQTGMLKAFRGIGQKAIIEINMALDAYLEGE